MGVMGLEFDVYHVHELREGVKGRDSVPVSGSVRQIAPCVNDPWM